MKAIRMGALDYIPKPFTPDELRNTVEHALSGELMEFDISAEERNAINIIDLDLPFDHDEVASQTGDAYVDSLGPSGMPVVEVKSIQPLEGFCDVGQMVCDIFKKLGATCKAGVKNAACPQKKGKKKAKGSQKANRRVKDLIGIDQPFSYKEVEAVTGPEYIRHFGPEGVSVPHYEELKQNVARMMAAEAPAEKREAAGKFNPDLPFDPDEVARQAGDKYMDSLGPSGMPVVEVKATEPLEGFCEVGEMVCDIFKKLGATCKAGMKNAACPQKSAKKKKKAAGKAVDMRNLIGPDMPFDVREVAATAGPEYVENLIYDGTVQMPYEKLKERMAPLLAEKPPKADQAVKEAATAPDARPILVIDDEVGVNNNIRKILAKNGFDVVQATTKQEAMDQLKAHTYQLVLLDLKIPGVQGLDLLKAVRDFQPEARVVMITGYATIETAVEAARMGAVGYVSKPFTPDEIRQATGQALQMAA